MSACDRYRCMSSFSWSAAWRKWALDRSWILLYVVIIGITFIFPVIVMIIGGMDVVSMIPLLALSAVSGCVGGFLFIHLLTSILYVIFKRIQFAMRKEEVEESPEE